MFLFIKEYYHPFQLSMALFFHHVWLLVVFMCFMSLHISSILLLLPKKNQQQCPNLLGLNNHSTVKHYACILQLSQLHYLFAYYINQLHFYMWEKVKSFNMFLSLTFWHFSLHVYKISHLNDYIIYDNNVNQVSYFFIFYPTILFLLPP